MGGEPDHAVGHGTVRRLGRECRSVFNRTFWCLLDAAGPETLSDLGDPRRCLGPCLPRGGIRMDFVASGHLLLPGTWGDYSHRSVER